MRVVIAGAGPAGSTAAWHLATAGVEVTVLEKTRFPREKVCGDGLTPRAVREMQLIGLPHGPEQGYTRTKGLKLIAAGRELELPWASPEFPDYGLVRTRLGFDEQLAEHARAAGAQILEGHQVTGVIEEGGRVVGLSAALLDENGRKTGETAEFRADLVLAADGNSTRTAVSKGLAKRDDRPLGVAYRAYFESPRTHDEWMEGWLELPDKEGRPLPGYGWIFGVGDGTVNVGLGILNSSRQFGRLDYRQVLKDWTAAMPAEWTLDPEHQRGRILGAALPMGFNRTPHVSPGLLLLGDAGGMVSPFNGEGISYAMESARLAADFVVRGRDAARGLEPGAARAAADRAIAEYAECVRWHWGSHFALGSVFAKLIGSPRVMRAALATGMPVPPLMKFVVRLMANLTTKDAVGLEDRAIRLIERMTPRTTNM
ncbi:geranylgeranyl reductase family protein [Falsarthrobacter nasiphocae]|uniref:Geranylgeranyl reductase family protein n=1 Tax=Falsarthrobacter nasiphocae TaxID=189863 RepID=A0AAE4C8I0_9MICC|nr:geranylgeranyl reductase family protein [Falsarthrobacter nasiphocae]MDR6892435.1 geranylgeranyl reductase family protein [Falsarthrobacter nasiphocae]